MKAITINEIGGIEKLNFVDIEKPIPKKGQVLVKIISAPVNFIDTIIREGKMPAGMMPELPFIPGVEASGIVENANDSSFTKGQKVAFLGSIGSNTYAEFALVDEDKLISLPEHIDLIAASAIPVNYFTAYHMMYNVLHVQQEKTAMIYAASGGVGTALIQLCKIAGIKTIALERNESKMDFPKNQGADAVICISKDNWKEKVKELTQNKGVDYIFNPIAGDSLKDSLELLATLGHIVVFGMLGGLGSINLVQESFNNFGKAPSIHFSEIYATYFSDFERVKQNLNTLFKLLEEGKISPIYDKIPMKDAQKAHKMIQNGKVKGKLVLINE